ncbi:MAG: hypothetical protein OMM_03014 [Candidatus Magnetoglobus multicellularis str. Araruama]|uniref:Calx-beta domain-containing protein n=1 Tax=Candidatus Magnetoglobus multicellularis str. Araruama TaxID=890399 RepID=A0A1V1P7G4_9BACT|nr:MAG: hypothetical protein OMM_03014 [Candidatus Magnetoglobus multicellularis str. Araruama]
MTKSSDGGNSFETPYQINSQYDKCAFDFDMVIDNDGTLYIPFTSTVEDHQFGDLYLASGKTYNWNNLTINKQITKTTNGNQICPKISIFSNTIYLSWYDTRYEESEIYLACSYDQGKNFESVLNVTKKPGVQFPRDMIVDNNGVYILASNFRYEPFATVLYRTGDFIKAAVILTESSQSTQVIEDGKPDNYIISLNRKPKTSVTVYINTDEQINTIPDYIVFTPENWDISQEVSVLAQNDYISEGLHTSTITHQVYTSDADFVGVSVNNIIVNVTDNDSIPFIEFSVSNAEGRETKRHVHIELGLSVKSSQDATVSYGISGGDAEDGVDYILDSGKAVIPAGMLTTTVMLEIINDERHENDEYVEISLGHPSENIQLGITQIFTYKINNDDFSDLRIKPDFLILAEGESGLYTVVLTSEPSDDVTVDINVSELSIVNAIPKKIMFSPENWNTGQQIQLKALEDTIFRGNKTVQINFLATSLDLNFKTGETKGIGITDNDPPPKPPLLSCPTITKNRDLQWSWQSDGGTGLFCYSLLNTDYCTESTATAYTHQAPYKGGRYKLSVKEKNYAGGWSETTQCEIELDAIAPQSQAKGPEVFSNESRTITISTQSNDLCNNSECNNYTQGSGIKRIELWAKAPGDKKFTIFDTHDDNLINTPFVYSADNKGVYQFYTIASDQALNNEDPPSEGFDFQSIYAPQFSGYAILGVGSIEGEEGLLSHTLTANRIYKHLIHRNFGLGNEDVLDHIKYFNPLDRKQTGESEFDKVGYFEGGALSYEEALKNAITIWAPEKMSIMPGPLYLILINHGFINGFNLYGDKILSPSVLDGWLDILESKVGTQYPIIITIGACHSGSFIDELSEPDKNRIIVTSAHSDEQSYRGPKNAISIIIMAQRWRPVHICLI